MATLYLVSSLFFALLHLPQGLASVGGAFLAGLVLMFVYRRFHTLLVPMGAHYLANLFIFGDGYRLLSLWQH